MSNIIDRRKNTGNKSSSNRQRFLKRVSGKIKKALPNIIKSKNIEGMTSGKVKVPVKGISEPSFRKNPKTGNKKTVSPGNDRFSEGDRMPKPRGGGQGGRGTKGSNDPSITEDDFEIELSKEEFLKYVFEDYELPNMYKKFMEDVFNYKWKRAGYTSDGTPSKLSPTKTYENSLARRLAVKGAIEREIKRIEELLKKATDQDEIDKLNKKLEELKFRLKNIPAFEHNDLRFRNHEKVPQPITSAVMFCIMDVSGSMGYFEKDISKRFFTLLYLFLSKKYENIELVFIRHHTQAKEVDEEEFFNSKESGGTIVLPSLELMDDIIQERYDSSKWNVYLAQCSDGDTWNESDAEGCRSFMENKILPQTQYAAYVEVAHEYEYFVREDYNSMLWEAYKKLDHHPNFAVRQIAKIEEIWPVFESLFKKTVKDEK
jgi:uncharacterized sporulation protein YeaH/YhbH (DUF444 family)